MSITKEQARALARIANGGISNATQSDEDYLHSLFDCMEDSFDDSDWVWDYRLTERTIELTPRGWKLLTEYQTENENVTDN